MSVEFDAGNFDPDNAEHVAKIISMIVGGPSGIKAFNDFREKFIFNIHLRSVDFSNKVLDGINFYRIIFSESVFTNTSLKKALFKGCDIYDCNFNNANLNEARIENSGVFSCSFEGANLTKLVCIDTVLNNIDLTRFEFTNSLLTSCQLKDCDLSGRNFSGWDLSEYSFKQCQLKNCDFSNSRLNSADFSSATLTGANLAGAKLQRANFSDTDLTGIDFSNTNLTGCIFADTNLTAANFHAAELSNSDFSGAIMHRSILVDANLTEASLRRADLTEASLSGSICSHADFSNAILYKANLRGAHFKGAFLGNAKLAGSEYDEVEISDAYTVPPDISYMSDSETHPYKNNDNEVKVIIYLPNANYTTDMAGIEELRKAVDDFMEAFGFELEPESDPIVKHGSWYGEAYYRAKKFFHVDEIKATFKSMKDTLLGVAKDNTKAAVLEKRAKATTLLLKKVENYDEVVLRLGDVVVVKTYINSKKKLMVETLSESLTKQLDDDPLLLQRPHDMIVLLSGGQIDLQDKNRKPLLPSDVDFDDNDDFTHKDEGL